MQKIIAAFDGLKFSASTRDYAIYIARLTQSHLTGVFMEDVFYSGYSIYDLAEQQITTDEQVKLLRQKDKVARKNSVKKFALQCQKEQVDFSVHHNDRTASHQLKLESVYADLLVIDSKETLNHHTTPLPTRFVRELLGDAHCPVLVVPRQFHAIEKVILLYDGEPSSVHAIKMFSYLLPLVKPLATEVIYAKPSRTTLTLPDKTLMRDFMKRHFPDAKYTLLKGWPQDKIVSYLKQSTGSTLVVLGAYRRGTVSRWFRESMADILMKHVKLPLFIAHNK